MDSSHAHSSRIIVLVSSIICVKCITDEGVRFFVPSLLFRDSMEALL
jgi:hypothetical protein